MVFSAIKSHSPIAGQPANPRKFTFAFFFRFFNSFRNFLVFLLWTQWEVRSSTLVFPSTLENVGPTGYIHQKVPLKRKNCVKRFLLPTERVFSTTFITNTIRWIKWRALIIMAIKICFTVKSPPQWLQKLHSVLLFIFVKKTVWILWHSPIKESGEHSKLVRGHLEGFNLGEAIERQAKHKLPLIGR